MEVAPPLSAADVVVGPGTSSVTVGDDSDLLTITPLGGGAEVGRSCIVVEFKGKTVMVRLNLEHTSPPHHITPHHLTNPPPLHTHPHI